MRLRKNPYSIFLLNYDLNQINILAKVRQYHVYLICL